MKNNCPSACCIAPVIVFFVWLLGYLAYLAVILRINHFDTYAVLNNARLIALGGDYPYEVIRPPLLSLLSSFLFLFNAADMMNVVIAARLIAVGIFAFYLYLAYNIFRLYLDQGLSLLGVILLSLNPLLIADAPFFREDILGSLLTAGCFYSYIRWKKGLGRGLWVSIFVSLAALSRFNLGPMIVLCIIILEGMNKISAREWKKVLLDFAVGPGAFFILVSGLVYWKVGVAELWRAPYVVLDVLREYLSFLQAQSRLYSESWTEVVGFLANAFSWPLLLLVIGGMAVAFYRKREGRIVIAVWAAVFLIFHTFLLGHKEARYLIVCFIPMYVFGLLAIDELARFVSKRCAGKGVRDIYVNVAVIMLVCALPFQTALRGIKRLQDPVYRTDFEQRISLYAKQMAGENPVFWVGRFYALHPKDYVFHLQDEVEFIYHFYNNVVRFFLQEEVIDYYTPVAYNGSNLFIPGIMPYIKNDAVLIVNAEPVDYATSNMPEKMLPLIVTKARIYTFRKAANEEGFKSSDLPGAMLEVINEDNTSKLSCTKLPKMDFELYGLESDGQFQSKGLFASGPLDINIYDLASSVGATEEIKLLTLSDVRLFEAP